MNFETATKIVEIMKAENRLPSTTRGIIAVASLAFQDTAVVTVDVMTEDGNVVRVNRVGQIGKVQADGFCNVGVADQKSIDLWAGLN